MIGSDPAAVAGAKLNRAVVRRVWRFPEAVVAHSGDGALRS